MDIEREIKIKDGFAHTFYKSISPEFENIEKGKFKITDNFFGTENLQGYHILGYVGEKRTNVVVPKKMEGRPVTHIGTNLTSQYFFNGIRSIVIPDTVVSVGPALCVQLECVDGRFDFLESLESFKFMGKTFGKEYIDFFKGIDIPGIRRELEEDEKLEKIRRNRKERFNDFIAQLQQFPLYD